MKTTTNSVNMKNIIPIIFSCAIIAIILYSLLRKS